MMCSSKGPLVPCADLTWNQFTVLFKEIWEQISGGKKSLRYCLKKPFPVFGGCNQQVGQDVVNQNV